MELIIYSPPQQSFEKIVNSFLRPILRMGAKRILNFLKYLGSILISSPRLDLSFAAKLIYFSSCVTGIGKFADSRNTFEAADNSLVAF